MELKRRNVFVYGLLAAVWLLVVLWQIEEHNRVKEVARTGMRNRSREVANFVSALIRGTAIRGSVFRERLDPVLKELVSGQTNELVRPSEVIWIALLNADGDPLASAGDPTIDPHRDVVPDGGLWKRGSMTKEYAVAGALVAPEAGTNQTPTVVLQLRDRTNAAPDSFRDRPPRREPRTDEPSTNRRPEGVGQGGSGQGNNRSRDGENRPRRPFWARGLDENAYQSLIKQSELHGLVLAMSTDTFQAVRLHDLWLRCIIVFFAGVAAAGAGLAWRNLAKSSDLQLRLVRTSELNTHLKEMNLAAAGLAHETRNPLNIIRGMAQMISKQTNALGEVREKSRAIVEESDKVTAQLNEFINYSRPREVRPAVLSLNGVTHEVVRALSYDIEEKKIRIEVKGERVSIEADEQLLRQVLFNLVLNAIQAMGENGEIQILIRRRNATEASLEVRDNGPGVPPENRREIFKPYFTTQPKGTGLGLAIVQQNAQAHGWEIECLANEPKGAIFRINHLKLAAKG